MIDTDGIRKYWSSADLEIEGKRARAEILALCNEIDRVSSENDLRLGSAVDRLEWLDEEVESIQLDLRQLKND